MDVDPLRALRGHPVEGSDEQLGEKRDQRHRQSVLLSTQLNKNQQKTVGSNTPAW
jgi:hypothetical protein